MEQMGFSSDDPSGTENLVQEIMHELTLTLYRLDNLRRCMSQEEWKYFCLTKTTRFSLFEHLLSDPFTKRVFEKHRGYSCDPTASDLLLGLEELKISIPLGRKIFQFIYKSDFANAIRHRREYIQYFIRDTSKTYNIPFTILSVLSGNIREIEHSKSFKSKILNNITAYDPDGCTIKTINKLYSHFGVKSINGTLNDLIFQKPINCQFNLVYSTGLLDHLDKHLAQKTIKSLFDLVQDSGYLLLTNFRENTPNTLYRTYLEAFTNWFIYYRTDEEMIDLFSDIDPSGIDDFQLNTDPCCNITYLLVRKK